MADSLSEHLTIIQGTFLSPARADARSRLSPVTTSNSVAVILLTVSGCKIPFSVMERDSDISSSSLKCFRGWALLGRIFMIGISEIMFSFLTKIFNRITLCQLQGLSLCYYNIT